MVIIGIGFIILALAQPQWGFEGEELNQEGVDIIIAIDVSNSMLAGDIKPNRLERAKRKIADLLQMMEGDRIGLVAFAGTSYLQGPLTLDYSAAEIFLDAIDTDLIPVQGNFALSQKFSEKHKAVDFAAPTGTEVVASAAGEILSVYYDKYFGNVMIVDHLNEYATLYAHLATSIYEAKTFVEKGETIALVGNTGNSTAPHLHFEILVNGENIDPEKILNIK